MLLVTGGAGFIGSNLIAALNKAGRHDVVINDVLGSDAKWNNLRKRNFVDFVPPHDLGRWLDGRKLDGVIHLGAISETTATDADLTVETNFRLSLRLADWCTSTKTPFIYASSAATYGDGSTGFDDDWSTSFLKRLQPLNLYGWSKHSFDLVMADRHARGQALPPQWVGLKFFNVFGPNEYHKGAQRSVVTKMFDTARANETVNLFKSYRPGVANGDQKRDFIYIEDTVHVMQWFLDNPRVSGIFNVGTGKAETFREVVGALYEALNLTPKIEYVDMPMQIREHYQYFTQASQNNLREAGYEGGFTPLKQAVYTFVRDYLTKNDPYN